MISALPVLLQAEYTQPAVLVMVQHIVIGTQIQETTWVADRDRDETNYLYNFFYISERLMPVGKKVLDNSLNKEVGIHQQL